MGDFTQVSTEALRAGTTTIDSDLAQSVVSIDLERLKVGTSRISNEFVSSLVGVADDAPIAHPFRELQVSDESEQIIDPLAQEPEGGIKGPVLCAGEFSVPRIAHCQCGRRVLVGIRDVHISSSLVADGIHADGSTHPTDAAPSPVRIRDGEWIEEER